jgi:hypothetical protein
MLALGQMLSPPALRIGAAANAASCCPPTQAAGFAERLYHENESRTAAVECKAFSWLLDSGTPGLHIRWADVLCEWSKPVAPRAYWKGYLKLSLVSCPIALFPATSEREKVRFHQIAKKTGNRIKYRKVDAETGEEVDSTDIIKGYEVGKGQYIEINPEELEAIAIESKRTIEIDEFVPKQQIDELYLKAHTTSFRTGKWARRLSRSSEKQSTRRVWSRSARSSSPHANT